MIHIQNLVKAYGSKQALKVDNLTINKGITGLIGNNGSGKTTLLRIILDLIKPTRGNVFINNEDVNNTEAWRKNVGSYLDEDCLINFLTPEEYLDFTRKLRGKSADDLQLFYKSMDTFFNGEILNTNKYINNFSKGNKQKIGIAAAILAEPALVILDEPSSHLDPASQVALQELLCQLHKQRNISILITSHNLSIVEKICDRIIVMKNGAVEIDTNDAELLQSGRLIKFLENDNAL